MIDQVSHHDTATDNIARNNTKRKFFTKLTHWDELRRMCHTLDSAAFALARSDASIYMHDDASKHTVDIAITGYC
jgi:hypothetical protein